MKLTKKKVVATATAVSLIAILSMGTLAWFTDSDEVTNEFLVADSSDTEPDDIFSVDVWEPIIDENGNTVDKDNDGNPDTTKDDEDGNEGNTYKDILPGDELNKEVHVENTGYYDQYVRVIITVSDADVWRRSLGETDVMNVDLEEIVSGYHRNMWLEGYSTKNYDATADELTFVLYYNDTLSTGEELVVFDKVVIPDQRLTVELAAEFDGGFTIDVKAQAVQTENVGTNAYEAFQTVGM